MHEQDRRSAVAVRLPWQHLGVNLLRFCSRAPFPAVNKRQRVRYQPKRQPHAKAADAKPLAYGAQQSALGLEGLPKLDHALEAVG